MFNTDNIKNPYVKGAVVVAGIIIPGGLTILAIYGAVQMYKNHKADKELQKRIEAQTDFAKKLTIVVKNLEAQIKEKNEINIEKVA